jgi:hypothetical protein
MAKWVFCEGTILLFLVPEILSRKHYVNVSILLDFLIATNDNRISKAFIQLAAKFLLLATAIGLIKICAANVV